MTLISKNHPRPHRRPRARLTSATAEKAAIFPKNPEAARILNLSIAVPKRKSARRRLKKPNGKPDE